MKILTGWAATAALVLAVTGANGQVPSDGMRTRYMPVSDLEGAYAPEVPAPRHGYRSGYGYDRGPALLPAEEVYAVLRENGFSPLGIPRLRGVVYTIAAIDRRGDDGRLVIDARDGRIVRFIPADRWGPPVEDDARTPYLGPYGTQGALPAPEAVRAAPRPPAPIPRVASRTVPLPKAAPVRGEVAAAPAPSAPAPQPSAAARARPQEATAVPQAAAPTVGQARPAPTILPTQDMPPALGLD